MSGAQHRGDLFFAHRAVFGPAIPAERPEMSFLRHVQGRVTRLRDADVDPVGFRHADGEQRLFDPAFAISAPEQSLGPHPGIGSVVDIAFFHKPGDDRVHRRAPAFIRAPSPLA